MTTTAGKKSGRPKVRAERIDTKCGYIGHMTVDEIKSRSFGEHVNVACPECGKIHLTVEETEEAEAATLRKNKRYAKIKADAEG
jgi:5-methylcytosine-specific restriction endonuclease McrA